MQALYSIRYVLKKHMMRVRFHNGDVEISDDFTFENTWFSIHDDDMLYHIRKTCGFNMSDDHLKMLLCVCAGYICGRGHDVV